MHIEIPFYGTWAWFLEPYWSLQYLNVSYHQVHLPQYRFPEISSGLEVFIIHLTFDNTCSDLYNHLSGYGVEVKKTVRAHTFSYVHNFDFIIEQKTNNSQLMGSIINRPTFSTLNYTTTKSNTVATSNVNIITQELKPTGKPSVQKSKSHQREKPGISHYCPRYYGKWHVSQGIVH